MMQPYELSPPASLGHNEQLEMLKMSVQRIFDAEVLLESKVTDLESGDPSSRRVTPAWNQSTKTMWTLLVAKLLTRGTGTSKWHAMATRHSCEEIDAIKSEVETKTETVMDTLMDVKTDIQQDIKPDIKQDTMDATDATDATDKVDQMNVDSDELKTMLLDFIIADLPQRYDLALEWLHEEFYCDRMHQHNNPHYSPSYHRWHLSLLERSISVLDAKDKTLSRLLMDAPAISPQVIEFIRKTMEEPSRFVSCASTLRDLVAYRPPVREQCLKVLLDFCVNSDVKTRSTSIVVVKKWVPDHPIISLKVEAFATDTLRLLTMEPPADEEGEMSDSREMVAEAVDTMDLDQQVEKDYIKCEEVLLEQVEEKPEDKEKALEVLEVLEEEVLDEIMTDMSAQVEVNNDTTPNINTQATLEAQVQECGSMDQDTDMKEAVAKKERNEWSELDVVRHAELFFALCVKKHELLKDLFNIYINVHDRVQRLIRQHVYNLIKSIGMHSPKLIETIRHFPPGGETLVIRILVVLCDTVRPTSELVNAVMDIYHERQLDAKFLIPIISGLRKEDIRQNLPKLVELLNNTEAQRKVVKKVFSRIVSNTGAVNSPMAPTELLMALHKMEENVPLPKAVEAINICFTMPDTFEAKHVANALQHLVEQPKIPLLLMVTMIRTVTVYKNLNNFILSLLVKLISKKVWAYPKLWDGFVKCTERTLPNSVKVLCNVALPNAQLKDIVLKIPSVRSPLREYAEQNSIMRILVMMKDLGFIEE
ncbi:Symplekin tight junction protein C terminal-domain-containing protein [Spinellus fusiger]|nr:Symplekin tight junction protein C terminal-domain-containing protein [Spinellus fusiger]